MALVAGVAAPGMRAAFRDPQSSGLAAPAGAGEAGGLAEAMLPMSRTGAREWRPLAPNGMTYANPNPCTAAFALGVKKHVRGCQCRIRPSPRPILPKDQRIGHAKICSLKFNKFRNHDKCECSNKNRRNTRKLNKGIVKWVHTTMVNHGLEYGPRKQIQLPITDWICDNALCTEEEEFEDISKDEDEEYDPDATTHYIWSPDRRDPNDDDDYFGGGGMGGGLAADDLPLSALAAR